MTDWPAVDVNWASDLLPARLPRDRLAVASVVLSSLWLWWAGSVLGLVLGVIALARARTQPQPLTSRRWALTGIALGLVGVITFATFVAPRLSTTLRHHFEDTAAHATLADLVTDLKTENASKGGFPVTLGTTPWRLPGDSDVVVVSPNTSSRTFKMVSAEVWDLRVAPGRGATVYAAVLSGTGTCFYLRERQVVEYALQRFGAGSCTGDSARDISKWSTSQS